MTFNTFTWNTTQPSPTQLISDGQTTILNNFGFLGFPNGNQQNGWVELPSGLILQWCLDASNYPPTTGTTKTFTGIGMKSFPTNCFIVVPVYHSQINKTHGAATISTITNTNFVITTDGSTLGFYYFAIGN